MRLATDQPDHLRSLRRIWLNKEAEPRRIASLRMHGPMALITLDGVRTPEEGAKLRGSTVRIAGEDARPLEPGEFFIYQVIGIDVLAEDGTRIGQVADYVQTGANDVVVVRDDAGKEQLFPNLPEVILELDPAGRRMVVRPLRYWDDR